MKLQRLYDTFKGQWNWCSVYHSSVSHSTSDFRAAVFENVRKLCLLPPARSVFQPQSIFRALESLSRCLDSTWKCKRLNTLLIKWQTVVPGHPSFQWTTPRCIPHGSSQSSAKSFWLPTAVLRSVMFLFFWLLWSPLPWTLLLPGISPQTVCTQVSALSSLLNEVKSLEDAKELTHSSEKR